MKQRFKPVMVVGLGKYGSDLAAEIYGVLALRQPQLTGIMSCLCLGDDGVWRDVQHPSTPLFVCEGLKSELAAEMFASNFSRIVAEERRFSDSLADRVIGLRRHDVIMDLHEKGYEIDAGIDLYLVSPLCDPIGSAGILPMLGFLQSLLSGRLRGTALQVNILGFFPDLFPEYTKEALAYTRAYACLQEIDFVGDHPGAVLPTDQPPFSYVYLFTSKNEDGAEIGSYNDLGVMTGELLCSLLAREIAADGSFGMVLARRVEDKATRYSSMGLGKLVLPMDGIMGGLSDYLAAALLNERVCQAPKTWAKERVAADVQEFVIRQRLDKLTDEISLDIDEKHIWADFTYEGPMDDQVIVASFLANLEQQVTAFSRIKEPAMNRSLSQKREALLLRARATLAETVAKSLDSRDKGVYYISAFLDVIQDNRSEYTKGDSLSEVYAIGLIERDAKRFFDPVGGVDRDTLLRLKRDLDAKVENLESELALVGDDTQIRAADSLQPADVAPSDAAPEVVRKWRRARPKDVSAPDAERVLDSGDHGSSGGIAGIVRKWAFQPKRLPDDSSAKPVTEVNDHTSKHGPPAPEHPRIVALRKQIEDLSSEHRALAATINHFDEKLSDPSERRRLLEEVLKPDDGKQAGLKTYLSDVDAQYREAGRRLDDLYEQRRRIVLRMVVIYPVLGMVAALLAAFFISPTVSVALCLIVLIFYAPVALLSYFRGIREEVRKGEAELDRLKGDKTARLLELQQFHNLRFRTIFEHTARGGLVAWVAEFKRAVAELQGEVTAFMRALENVFAERNERFNQLAFTSNVFGRSVATRADVDRFIAESPRLPVERANFFGERPLSGYFHEFQGTRNLNGLLEAVRRFTEHIFKPVRDLSIEEFLGSDKGRLETAAKARIDRLYASAKAFIQLDVETASDGAQSMVYLGVEDINRSVVGSEVVRQFGGGVTTFSTGNRHELVMSRLKIGFPAFHVALVKYGRTLSKTGGASCHVSAKWPVTDLIPSIYTLGDVNDEVRQISGLGRAFGLITTQGGRFYFAGKDLGGVVEELDDALRAFSAAGIRDALRQGIAVEKRQQGAIEKLAAYHALVMSDPVEAAIIQGAIDELNPLA